jgi:hypothetical protein
VFSTCIHCHAPLGRNEAIEAFPVGSRLAFDARRGRLWVVCRACERWNLSALEERWEAIEECERRFTDTRLRTSTDEIGLARLREGVDLIRIGEPKRPEFAAWRYGDQFGRRRTRQLLVTGTAVSAIGALYVGGLWAGASLGGFIFAGQSWIDPLINGRGGAVVARVRGAEGDLLTVQRRHARMSALVRGERDEPFTLRLEHTAGTAELTGDIAERAAQQLLPTVNRFGGSRRRVQEAVDAIERAGDPYRFAADLARSVGWRPGNQRVHRTRGDATLVVQKAPGTFEALDPAYRLALEMALHEEQERRAMEGELQALAEQWREAEEIAAIADGLFVSPAVDARLQALRREGTRPPESV